MQSLRTSLNRTLLARPTTTHTVRLVAPAAARMSSSAGELKIESTNIKTAPGIELSSHRQTLIGSVLDLFAGRPSLPKLQLWTDDAEFTDPLTIAKGRKQYEAQWYGLQTAFSEIERLGHEVKNAGNPITMDLETRYVVKGIGSEKVIKSLVEVHTDAQGEKIIKVADKWDGQLPEGSIAQVRVISWNDVTCDERHADSWLRLSVA